MSGGWADAGREGRGGGPPFKPVRCSLSGSSPLALAIWRHGARLVTFLPFGPVLATASSSSSPLVLSWRRLVLAYLLALLPDWVRELIEATPHPSSTSPATPGPIVLCCNRGAAFIPY